MPRRARPTRLEVFLAAALMAACSGPEATPQPPSPPDLAPVGPELHALFDAIDQSDCDALAVRLPTMRCHDDCLEFLEQSRDHGLGLVSIGDIVRDGRDPSSAIVHSVLRRGTRTQEVLIRATRIEGQWTFAM
jgi:hypothetical protein